MGKRLKNAKHLTAEKVAEIKWLALDGQYTSLKEIAEKYGCSATMVSRIRDEKSWGRIIPRKPLD